MRQPCDCWPACQPWRTWCCPDALYGSPLRSNVRILCALCLPSLRLACCVCCALCICSTCHCCCWLLSCQPLVACTPGAAGTAAPCRFGVPPQAWQYARFNEQHRAAIQLVKLFEDSACQQELRIAFNK